MGKDPNLDSLDSHRYRKGICAEYNLYNSMFASLCITVADGWGPTLQSGGNQLIGLKEIDMVPAANPSFLLSVHQSHSAITPLIGQC